MTDSADPATPTTSFHAVPLGDPSTSATHDHPGAAVARYKLLEKVGEGGFGVVYVAEQKEPVKRRVALKIIKLGMDTKQVVARFEAERQALALMDHPNIAKVLDAGATDTGRPFFVMELVRGIRITDYADQHKLPVKTRLELFIQVCHAIQHAHQKGIIHRDIKPSNILVTLHDGIPVPKVIDFGIAKATQGDLTDNTVYTQLQQFIGTPAYMSPEQAEMSGLDIDTRSDIYSLGVLLYELLTGRTPFDGTALMSQGIDAMRKAIREQEPTKPSSKLATLKNDDLSTTAARHAAEAPKLIHQLKGDLDWIVMKCLEKDRTRRYDTATGLAAEIKRHLNDEPVLARPPSRMYRLQKSLRRNKGAYAAGTAIVLVLLIGIAASSWQAIRATAAKRDALLAQDRAQTSEQKALTAQSAESRLRLQAQSQELAARQRAYASDMNVASQALRDSNLGLALDLLDRQRPAPGQQDLRGWEWRYLWGQTRSDALFTLCRKSEIGSLTVSGDGRWLAIGMIHKDGLSVWDLQTRREVAQLAKGESDVSAALSPTEPLLAFTTQSTPAMLHVWNPATRQSVVELPLDRPSARLAFSNDGRSLLTSTEQGEITLWRVSDWSKGVRHQTPDRFNLSVTTDFAATPDLHLAAYAYGYAPQRIRVIDLHDGKELWNAGTEQTFITALAFSPDGKTLAFVGGFADSQIHLWDVATGKEIGTLDGHGSWVSSLVFWPDGKKLASSSGDQTIRIWDVEGRKCLDVLRGHRLEVFRLALSPDGKTLVSGGKDGTVCVWDTSVTHPRRARIEISERIGQWCFSADGQSVVTIDGPGQIAQWKGTDFQQKDSWVETQNGLAPHAPSNLLSPDGRLLACGDEKGNLQVWDLSRRRMIRQWTSAAGGMRPLVFLTDGTRLISASETNGSLHQWDVATGRELQSFSPTAEYVVPGSEERLVSIAFEGGVRIQSLADGQTTEMNLDAMEVRSGAFSPDEKLFAVASDLGYARVWDAVTWKEIKTLDGFLLSVSSLGFSRDGSRLATTSDKQQALRLWDTKSWQNVLTLEGDGSNFGSVAFSPDGNAVGAMNIAGKLQLWRAPSWEEIHAAEQNELKEAPTPLPPSPKN